MKSLFEAPIFRNNLIVGWQTKEEIRKQSFCRYDWTVERVNNRSLLVRHNRTNELFLIGARTFNELVLHSHFVKYVKVPNPKNPGQVLNWIKIDK